MTSSPDGWALLGVDLGTGSAKAVVLGDDGRVLARASAPYPVTASRPGEAEADPAAWERAVAAAVRGVLARVDPDRVRALGVDGQMHGLVLADGHGNPVRPALVWADSRAREQAQAWAGLPADVLARLANPVVPGMAGPLWAWVAAHEPGALARARWALQPKDWLRLRLTGSAATDPSDASATLLWDVPADGWASDVLAAAGLDPALLPPVLASGALAGPLRADAARRLGLPAGLPVAVGAADTAAALLGGGLREGTSDGQVLLAVGSGAQVVRAGVPGAAAGPGVHVYRQAGPGWYAMAAVQGAGVVLDRVRTLLGATWEQVYAAAAADPGGVVVLPRLVGERGDPPGLRGAVLGWDQGTDATALLAAALRGVAATVADAVDRLPGPAPGALLLAGGGAAAPAWRQLLADVLGVPLRPLRVPDASAVGAALLAADAAGLPRPPVDTGEEPRVEPGSPAEWRAAVRADHEAALAAARAWAARR